VAVVEVARPPRVRSTSTLAGDLEVPWGLTFLRDGSALVAQRRSGEVVLVRPDGSTRGVGRVPGVADRGEGGLLGLATTPGDPGQVFAYLTTDDDNRVVSMPFDGKRLGEPRVLLAGIPAGSIHNGGRLAIGPDGLLYIGTGDAGERNRAQSSADLGGKILRIATDGSIPADNPDPGSPVWSRGHRNVQGLAFDSAGRLWATEFGQNRLDELNRIEAGGNYGWPVVEGRGGGDRFVDPQAVWPTDQASPSGLAIVDDVAVLAGLRGERLWLVPLDGGRAGEPVDALAGEHGRLRTVALAADGSLWVTTSNRDGRGVPRDADDRILRVRLA
jgi:glucose/arabinose dehydrogenase